ncbi:hypothetical protein FKP32DRAFT_906199 [Trametes sanguinea]|nr:hypothetical protein FKP32DRAFT_906199 [Trametes sanguinea]
MDPSTTTVNVQQRAQLQTRRCWNHLYVSYKAMLPYSDLSRPQDRPGKSSVHVAHPRFCGSRISIDHTHRDVCSRTHLSQQAPKAVATEFKISFALCRSCAPLTGPSNSIHPFVRMYCGLLGIVSPRSSIAAVLSAVTRISSRLMHTVGLHSY